MSGYAKVDAVDRHYVSARGEIMFVRTLRSMICQLIDTTYEEGFC